MDNSPLLVLLAHAVSASIILHTLCYIRGGQAPGQSGKVSKTVNSYTASDAEQSR
jgi:hypothetical protein